MRALNGRSSIAAALLALALVAGGCGDDSSDDATSTTTTSAGATTTEAPLTTEPLTTEPLTTEPAPTGDTLRILVTNDDGIAAPGLDVMVEALRTLPNTEVTVIAPAENQSGTGGKTTEGDVDVVDTATISGYASRSVAGFPADAVIFALDKGGLTERPHVVLSGINQGANVGPLTNISGTVGAARAAATRGIPALAASQGLATEPDYDAGATFVLDWVARYRDELIAGTKAPTVDSLNIPSCPSGEIRGQVEVPTGTDAEGRELFTSNCASTLENPVDDIEAFSNGYTSLSPVSLTG